MQVSKSAQFEAILPGGRGGEHLPDIEPERAALLPDPPLFALNVLYGSGACCRIWHRGNSIEAKV